MKLKVLVTTDLHGNIYPTNYTSRDNIEDFGLARIATAIKKLRKENKNFLLIDNGDSFQGTPINSYAIENNLNNVLATAFNYLDYDFLNIGNHDYNYGEDILLKFIKENNAKVITSNLNYKDKPLGSSKILEIENKKIGLIGVCTHYIPNWEQPDHIKHSSFFDAYEKMESEVSRLIDKVDYIIGVYHGGLERDPKTGEPTETLTGENQGYQMSKIKGLDLLLTGHQHRSLVEKVNNTIITQSTFKGEEFIEVDIDLTTFETNAKLVYAKDYEPDKEILKMFSSIQDKTQDWLDNKVGSIKGQDLLIKNEFEARLNKHPLVSFINQVQLEVSGADISSASLFNGVVGFNQEISMRDLVNTYIYPNTLTVKEISGKNLKEAVEVSLRYFDIDDNNNIKVEDSFEKPKPQHYNYDMYDGIEYTAKISNKIGERLVSITKEGKPIDDDKMYTLVINNYRAMGAGGYDMIGEAKTLKEIRIEMIDILKDYLQKNSPIEIKHQDNIKIEK